MTKLTLKKNQAAIVARSGSSEQVLKIEVLDLDADHVTLNFDDSGGFSIHPFGDWQRAQTERQAARLKQGSDRPKQRAPYMN